MVGLINILANGFTDDSGVALSAGTVTFYEPGTTTAKTCYAEFALSTPLANPSTLDSAGRLTAFTNGRVKLLIKNSAGATIKTVDNVGIEDAQVSSLFTAQSTVPAGTILAYGGTTGPTGFLLCDGGSYLRTDYADLFTAIGTAFGAADSTHFNVPDFRGRFLRGYDGTASIDPDKASRTALKTGGNIGNNIGSEQADATAKNSLALTDPGHDHSRNTSGFEEGATAGSGSGGYSTTSGSRNFYAYTDTSADTTGITLGNGDSETRPINVAVNFIIKT
jgi:microcystin-dependent protein